jgi:hypothetical protein
MLLKRGKLPSLSTNINLVLLILLMVFFSGWLRADAYKEQRTGIQFPDAVAGFKRGQVSPYEAEAGKAGVAIDYRSEDAEVTVYIRASSDESPNTSAEFLKESLAAVKVLESQGKYSNVKIYKSDPGKERPGWSSGAFTSSSTNHFLVSFICCKVVPGHMFKIRASTGNPNNDKLQSFTKSIQELLDNASKKP